MDPDMTLSGRSVWVLNIAPDGVRLATHNRLLLSTLKSPGPSLFIMLKMLHFFFSPI